MRILEINVTEFGCLKDLHLELGDGINIVGGDNESGKSTLMLFIRFMFYGLPKKSQKNYDRERSLSFDGHRAAGSLVLEHGGVKYRIERVAVGTTKVSESLKIFDLDAARVIDGEPWERFLGVTADVFTSSCAINQSKVSSIDKASAAHALENMLASADESIDVSAILDSIDKVRREYRLNRGEGGILFELDKKIAALEARKRDAETKQLNINRLKLREVRLNADLEVATAAVADAEKSMELAKKAEIIAQFDALRDKKRQRDALCERLSAIEGDFKHPSVLPVPENATAIDNACRDLRLASQKHKIRASEHKAFLERTASAFPLAPEGERITRDGGAATIYATAAKAARSASSLRFLAILSAALALALIPVCILIGVLAIRLIAAGVAVLAAAGAVTAFAVSSKRSKLSDEIAKKYSQKLSTLLAHLNTCVSQYTASVEAKQELSAAEARLEDAQQDEKTAVFALASLIGADDKTGADTLIAAAEGIAADVRELCEQKKRISLDLAACDALIDNAESALAEYDENALRAELGDDIKRAMTIADAERAMRFAMGKKDSLARDVSTLRISLATSEAGSLESPVEIGDAIKSLRREKKAKERYFDALILAKETIERAQDSMSGNVTPEISRKASEIMALVSGGRHPALRTSRGLELSVDEDGFGYPVHLLSEGAKDASYIALRISLMLRIFGTELPPLMLDDALCQLDDTRAESMIRLLARLSALPMQSLIFTCHERESRICESVGVPHTYNRLSR